MSECRNFIIVGQVQGVFFRASTQHYAQSIGVRGWVRNLPDGLVEVEACGDTLQLDSLQNWLWQGPQYAKVSDVQVGPGSGEDVDLTFVIKT